MSSAEEESEEYESGSGEEKEFNFDGGDREDEDGSVEGSDAEEGEQDGSEEGSDGEGDEVANPKTVREKIDFNLEVLGNFKERADKSKSRADILTELATELSEYYGYTEELSNFLLELFSPAECVEYMDASDRPRPMVIRTNTLKTTRKDLMEQLGKRGANVEAIEWSKVAIKVTESAVPIGATPEYLAGHYMLQSAASLNPVMALAPKVGEKVLDMSAAPGGKTTYISQLMKNTGSVTANDLKPVRQKSTVANLHRMGVKNSIVCCYDGRKMPNITKGFDRALLDAPCSGLGVISRDQTVKIQRTVKDIQRVSHLQKELLLAAIDCIDHKSSTGGVVVYSTCSISVEENEQVVAYALKKRFVRLVETGLEVGKPGFTRHKEKRFHPSMALTKRFYPHVHNMDGFYVAKFQKYAAGPQEDYDHEDEDEDEEEENVDSEEEEDMDMDDVKGSGDEIGEGSDKEEEDSDEEEEDSDEEEQVEEEGEDEDEGEDEGDEMVEDESSADDEEPPAPEVPVPKKSNKKARKEVKESSDEEVDSDSDVDPAVLQDQEFLDILKEAKTARIEEQGEISDDEEEKAPLKSTRSAKKAKESASAPIEKSSSKKATRNSIESVEETEAEVQAPASGKKRRLSIKALRRQSEGKK